MEPTCESHDHPNWRAIIEWLDRGVTSEGLRKSLGEPQPEKPKRKADKTEPLFPHQERIA